MSFDLLCPSELICGLVFQVFCAPVLSALILSFFLTLSLSLSHWFYCFSNIVLSICLFKLLSDRPIQYIVLLEKLCVPVFFLLRLYIYSQTVRSRD